MKNVALTPCFRKDFQKVKRIGIVGPVVKGQRQFARPRRAANKGSPVELPIAEPWCCNQQPPNTASPAVPPIAQPIIQEVGSQKNPKNRLLISQENMPILRTKISPRGPPSQPLDARIP